MNYLDAATKAAEALKHKAEDFKAECDGCSKCRVYREHGIATRCPKHEQKWLNVFGGSDDE